MMNIKPSAKTLTLGALGVTGTSLGIAALVKSEPTPEMSIQPVQQDSISKKDFEDFKKSIIEQLQTQNFIVSGHSGLWVNQTDVNKQVRENTVDTALNTMNIDAIMEEIKVIHKNLEEKVSK